MLLGVVGDTHRHHYEIRKAIEKIKNVDIIIHLGDNVEDIEKISSFYKGDILGIRGNCDISSLLPSERVEIIGNKKIFITHGHKYDVRNGLSELEYKASQVGADIVLYGHTHISQIVFEKGIYFVNPGSPAIPRDGFCSVATIEIKDDEIVPLIINV